jgi:thiol:disulfide interchange protein
VAWESSVEKGMNRAAAEQRPALLEFHSAWNEGCRKMDFEVFPDEEVQASLQDYVPIRLDYHLNRDLADQMGVQTLPAFFVFRADGSLAGSHQGVMDADKFSYFLIRYRFY